MKQNVNIKQEEIYKKRKIVFLIVLLVFISLIVLIVFLNKSKNIQKLGENYYTLNIGGVIVDTSKVLTNEPNTPQLGAGMIPIKWDGEYFQITTKDDKDWYNFETGKLPTIMLSDGYYKSELEQGIDEKKQLAANNVGVGVLGRHE